MPFADTAQLAVGYIEEVTWGTTPATPELTALRITGESLKKDLDSIVSGEIRSDRQIEDAIVVGGQIAGDFKFELSYGEYDVVFSHLFMNAWVSGQTDTGTNLALSGATITDSGSGFVAGTCNVGQWIKISGSATGSNDGLYRITSFATGTLNLVDDQGVTAAFTADSANASLKFSSSDRLINGTTKKSFTLEKGSSDINQFHAYTGMRTQGMSLDFSARAAITGAFSFLGKGLTTASSTIDNAGGYTASQTNSILNGADHLYRVWLDAVEFTGAFKTLNITVDNGMRPQEKIGASDLAGVGVGRFNVSGKLEAYYEDLTLFDKFQNNTYVELAVLFDDDTTSTIGNVYALTILRAKFLTGDLPGPQADADIMQTLEFQATRDSTPDATMILERFASTA